MHIQGLNLSQEGGRVRGGCVKDFMILVPETLCTVSLRVRREKNT